MEAALTRLMGLDARAIDARLHEHPPTALLVGEAPGPRGGAECPLFPYPPHMAGGRLLRLAGIEDVTEYLCRYARTNLLPTFSRAWASYAAAREAGRLLAAKRSERRWLLLGRRVAGAFGYPGARWYQWFNLASSGSRQACCIPHPSGRSRTYNDPRHRAWLAQALQEALE